MRCFFYHLLPSVSNGYISVPRPTPLKRHEKEHIYKYLFSLSHCSTSLESLSNQPIFARTAS